MNSYRENQDKAEVESLDGSVISSSVFNDSKILEDVDGFDDTVVTKRNVEIYKPLFDLGPISTNEELGKVKKFVKQILGRKAIKLRHEINLGMKAIEKELETLLEEIKIHAGLLKTLDQDIKEARTMKHSALLLSLEKTKKTTLDAVKIVLKKVSDREEKLKSFRDSWEYFRIEYKEEILKIVRKEIEKKTAPGAKNYEDSLDFTYFLPDFMKSENSGLPLLKEYFTDNNLDKAKVTV